MEYLFTAYPLGTIAFLRKVYLLGLATGLVMHVPVVWWIARSDGSGLSDEGVGWWWTGRLCDRVLRSYHLLRVGLFVAQIPLRAVMMRRLYAARALPTRDAVVDGLIAVMKSRCWQLNQTSGILSYLMFAFALVFALCGSHCDATSRVLYRCCILHLVIFLAHMACSCLWLRQVTLEDPAEAAYWKRGITPERIEQLTRTIVMPDLSGRQAAEEEEESQGEPPQQSECAAKPPRLVVVDGFTLHSTDCSVCFCDYEAAQSIRILPCQHHYHRACIDEWLQRCKKQCPLCQREIDTPVAQSDAYLACKVSLQHRSPKVAPLEPEATATLRHRPKAHNRDIIVGAALTDHAAPSEAASLAGAANAPDAGVAAAAASDSIASSPAATASASASAAPSAAAPSAAAPSAPSTLPLSGSLRRRRDGSTSPRIYSTQSAIETPSATNDAAATTSDTAASDSVLLHRGQPVAKPTARATLTAPAASAPSSSAKPRPVAPTAAAAAAAPAAAPLSADRAAYAASRLSLASQAWRAQLEEWAEQPDEEEEEGEESKAMSAQRPASQVASGQDALLDHLVQQWQLEEAQQTESPTEEDESS